MILAFIYLQLFLFTYGIVAEENDSTNSTPDKEALIFGALWPITLPVMLGSAFRRNYK